LSERKFLLFAPWSATFMSLNSTFNCVIFFWRNSIIIIIFNIYIAQINML
jgi:hypothetical protein